MPDRRRFPLTKDYAYQPWRAYGMRCSCGSAQARMRVIPPNMVATDGTGGVYRTERQGMPAHLAATCNLCGRTEAMELNSALRRYLGLVH